VSALEPPQEDRNVSKVARRVCGTQRPSLVDVQPITLLVAPNVRSHQQCRDSLLRMARPYRVVEYKLPTILRWGRGDGGILAIPDFQREHIWETKRVVELVASIFQGLPIGSMCLGKVPIHECESILRGLERADGVYPSQALRSEHAFLLIDGRQRTQALLRALRIFVKGPSKLANHTNLGIDLLAILKLRQQRHTPSHDDWVKAITPSRGHSASTGTLTAAMSEESRVLKAFKRGEQKEPKLWMPLNYFTYWIDQRAQLEEADSARKVSASAKQATQTMRETYESIEQLRDLGVRNLFQLIESNLENAFVNCTVLERRQGQTLKDYLSECHQTFVLLNQTPTPLTQSQGVVSALRLRPALDSIARAAQHRFPYASLTTIVLATPDKQLPNETDETPSILALTKFLGNWGNFQFPEIEGDKVDHARRVLTARAKALEQVAPSLIRFFESSCGMRALDECADISVFEAFCAVVPTVDDGETDDITTGHLGGKLRAWWWRTCVKACCDPQNPSFGRTRQLARELKDLIDARFPEDRFPRSAMFQLPEIPDYASKSQSGSYRLFVALLQSLSLRDLRLNQTEQQLDQRWDLHHIFPKACGPKLGIPREQINSFANITLIHPDTNRKYIGSRRPSTYIKVLERDSLHLSHLLAQHGIADIEALKRDDFRAVLQQRAGWLRDTLRKQCEV